MCIYTDAATDLNTGHYTGSGVTGVWEHTTAFWWSGLGGWFFGTMAYIYMWYRRLLLCLISHTLSREIRREMVQIKAFLSLPSLHTFSHTLLL
jgi:hypothetical protein